MYSINSPHPHCEYIEKIEQIEQIGRSQYIQYIHYIHLNIYERKFFLLKALSGWPGKIIKKRTKKRRGKKNQKEVNSESTYAALGVKEAGRLLGCLPDA